MDKLIQPDTGLMYWTALTFVLLLVVLWKAAWRPILDGINAREAKIRGDVERAERAQAEAEALRKNYESQLAEAQRSIQEMVAQARKDSERTRADLVAKAHEEADRVLSSGRKSLEAETARLKAELRNEVAGLSVTIAEKILRRAVDERVQTEVLKESLASIGEAGR